MPTFVEAAIREELRRAGLAAQGSLPRLLAILRQSPDTHLTTPDIADLLARGGVAITLTELAHQLEILTAGGLISRLPTPAAEVVWDLVPEAHAHFVYGDFDQIIDMHVSEETLLAMIRDALAQRPGGVEVFVRFRHEPRD